MTRYYTYKSEAMKHWHPGQRLRFTEGKGYWISGTPTDPPQNFRMYDAVNLANLPKGAPAYAGYVNGHWPTYNKIVRDYPRAMHLSIAVSSSADAECLDVELGDATNQVAPGWVKRQKARGVKLPILYTFLANAQPLIDYMSNHGYHWGSYKLWVAHWNFEPHICSPKCGYGLRHNAHASQWTDKALQRSLDESLCTPGFIAGDSQV